MSSLSETLSSMKTALTALRDGTDVEGRSKAKLIGQVTSISDGTWMQVASVITAMAGCQRKFDDAEPSFNNLVRSTKGIQCPDDCSHQST
jgi:hypothetical protein